MRKEAQKGMAAFVAQQIIGIENRELPAGESADRKPFMIKSEIIPSAPPIAHRCSERQCALFIRSHLFSSVLKPKPRDEILRCLRFTGCNSHRRNLMSVGH